MPLNRIRLIAVLGLGQIFAWGTTFDMPGVLGRTMASDLGMANETAFAGLSTMMLVMALCGPWVGRLLARHGALAVLLAGEFACAAGLALLAFAQGPIVYFAAWFILGIGGALALTVPTFAAVVEREGAGSKRAIAILMIFTGLSASVCWPLWSLLEASLGWRHAILIAAAFHIVVMVPLIRFGLPAAGHHTAEQQTEAQREPLTLTPARAMAALVLVGLVSALFNLVTTGIAPSLLALLTEAGATPALALQLGSLRSVFGISARAADLMLGKRATALTSGTIAASLILAALPMLWLSGGSLPMLFAFIVFYGLGSGISGVTRALLPLVFFSPSRYARISSNLSVTSTLAMAAGPVLSAAILDRTGSHGLILYSAAITAATLVGLGVLGMIARAGHRDRATVTP